MLCISYLYYPVLSGILLAICFDVLSGVRSGKNYGILSGIRASVGLFICMHILNMYI